MAKQTLLTLLEENLSDWLTNYDFEINWNTKQHRIEILIQLLVENPDNLAIEDSESILSDEAMIEFVDGILLYDEKQPLNQSEVEEYLAVIPFSRKAGIQQGEIFAIGEYVEQVAKNGEKALKEFLSGSTNDETFELCWDTAAFEKIIERYMKKQENLVFIPYPKY